MWLTNLADVARRTGFKVVETPGWKTRGHGEMLGVYSVACHDTVSGAHTGDAPSLDVIMNGRPDLKGPLSQFLIARSSGTIYVAAAGLCWHAGAVQEIWQANPWAVGIEVENNGVDEPWSTDVLNSYHALCAELCKEFNVAVGRVLGHKEICYPAGRKVDPDLDMAVFRRNVANYLKPAPPIVSPAPFNERNDQMLGHDKNGTVWLFNNDLTRRRIYSPEQVHDYQRGGMGDMGLVSDATLQAHAVV